MSESWVSLISHWPRQVRYGAAGYPVAPFRLVDENGGEVPLVAASDTVTTDCYTNGGALVASPVTATIVDGKPLVALSFNVSDTATYPLAENYRLVLTITDTSASRVYTREVYFHVVRQPLEFEISDAHIPTWIRPPKGETTHARALQSAYSDLMGFMSLLIVASRNGRPPRVADSPSPVALYERDAWSRFQIAPIEYRSRPWLVFDRQHAHELVKALAIKHALEMSITAPSDAFATQAERQANVVAEKQAIFVGTLAIDWTETGDKGDGLDTEMGDIGRMRQ